jgi:hypothetical protein
MTVPFSRWVDTTTRGSGRRLSANVDQTSFTEIIFFGKELRSRRLLRWQPGRGNTPCTCCSETTRRGTHSAPEGRAFWHIRWASNINLPSLRYLPTESDGFASRREERHPLRRVSGFFPRHRRGEFVAVCRRNPKTYSQSGFYTMFYRFGRNAAKRIGIASYGQGIWFRRLRPNIRFDET